MSDRISGGIIRDSSAIVSSGISGGVRKVDLLAGQRIVGAVIFAAPSAAGSGASDHGVLTGLADDDHPQYFNQVRGDTRYRLLTQPQGIDTITGLQIELDGKQNTDIDLTALAGLTTTGFLRRTGDGTAEARVLQAGDIPDISSTYQTTTGFTTHTNSAGNGAHIPSGGITNTNIATGAAIDWGKISKAGAVAGDVGAQPANANLTTLAGTNLAIDLSLYSDTTPYTEFAYSSGNLSQVQVFTQVGGTLLKTTTFTYSGGNLTQVVTTDGTVTRTKAIGYDGGNVVSITGS